MIIISRKFQTNKIKLSRKLTPNSVKMKRKLQNNYKIIEGKIEENSNRQKYQTKKIPEDWKKN